MSQTWDVIVIGAGVAGLTAAETVASGGLTCLCIDRMGPGGVLINLGALSDCPDLPDGTSGPDHVAALTEAAMTAGAELSFGEVQAVSHEGHWTVTTDAETHTAWALIFATGLGNGAVAADGVERFEGQGLSHCAACDGPLYAGQPVVVEGNDRWALQEALELAEIAGQVTLATGDGAPDDDARLQQLGAHAKVAIVPARVVGLDGTDGLETVTLERDGQRDVLQARALFAYAGRRPGLGFAGAAVDCDAAGRIRVDAGMSAGPHFCFAAGDVRAGALESIADARADGQRAGKAALQALSA